MKKDVNSYSSIIKSTTLFGSVQVFNVLINLIRGKLVALILGPEGMGISSLLNSSMNVIQQFTGLGLNMSCIQEISRVDLEKEQGKIAFVVAVIRRLLYITATIGSLLSILFSSYLSTLTFGNSDYTWYFIFLSLAIFFTTLSNGESSILQGLHVVKRLAFSSVVSSLIGLFIGVPLYYFLGFDGIVPAMIVLSLSTFLFYRYNTYKALNVRTVALKWRIMSPLAKKMISLGLILMLSSLLGTLVSYILNTFIIKYGSLEDVGLFQAANSITCQYIGLVFTAMSIDFYPRLSAVSSDNNKVKELVNRQMQVITLIIFPIAILLIITAPVIIRLLLTEKFLSLIPVIRVMGFGIVFKAFAYPMGYISFSKGDKKIFFWLEGICSNLLMLIMNIAFYKYLGIYGLGISFVLLYILFVFIYIITTKYLYDFTIDHLTYKLFLFNFLFIMVVFVISLFELDLILYLIMSIIFIINLIICIYYINKNSGVIGVFFTKYIRK